VLRDFQETRVGYALTYVWKKNFFIRNVTFDSKWESPDKKFVVEPIAGDKEIAVYGYYSFPPSLQLLQDLFQPESARLWAR